MKKPNFHYYKKGAKSLMKEFIIYLKNRKISILKDLKI